MRAIYRSTFATTIIGLCLGVFYREFTKIMEFTGKTTLSFLHVHTLVLGTLFLLILLLLDKQFQLTAQHGFKTWFIIYHVGLWGTVASMGIRGVLQVLGSDLSGLNHIAGTFHATMGIALVWFLVILGKALRD